ncbi:MAG: pyrroline-5-carboxylate reductase, partial [Clostridiales bacterium]|nr:pyrroline-5-carboxylate reductase [Clostridiales bacterium]
MAKLGFIGAGNMAAAIVGGIVKNGAFAAAEIAISDVDVNRCEEIRGEYGVNISAENICIARNSEIILLCVKPNILNEVIAEIRPHIKEEQLIISIAAGWTLAQLQGAFGGKARIVRVMPNTPALVNAAMTAICAAEDVSEADIRAVAEIFGAIGRTQILPERLFDAFIGVAGSSPAYAFIFIDALADAGVKYGLN